MPAGEGWPFEVDEARLRGPGQIDARATGTTRRQTSVLLDGGVLLDLSPALPPDGVSLAGVHTVLVTHAHPDQPRVKLGLADLLAAADVDHILTREPGGTELGVEIRCNTPVQAIRVHDGSIDGVEIEFQMAPGTEAVERDWPAPQVEQDAGAERAISPFGPNSPSCHRWAAFERPSALSTRLRSSPSSDESSGSSSSAAYIAKWPGSTGGRRSATGCGGSCVTQPARNKGVLASRLRRVRCIGEVIHPSEKAHRKPPCFRPVHR